MKILKRIIQSSSQLIAVILICIPAFAYNIGDLYIGPVPSGCNLLPPVHVYHYQEEIYYAVRYQNCENTPNGCPTCPEDNCYAHHECKEVDQGNGNFVIFYTVTMFAHTCYYIYHETIAKCGGRTFVDWTNWSEETCTGAICLKQTEFNLGSPNKCDY